MIAALAGVAVLAVAGAVAATSLRDGRARLLGITLALTLAPFLDDPFPAPVPLALRVVAAVLAAFLIRATLLDGARGEGEGRGDAARMEDQSPLGWPSDALLAVAAGAIGLALAQGLPGAGPGVGSQAGVDLEAVGRTAGSTGLIAATGCALVALGAAPALLGRTAGRVAVGLLLLAQGLGLVRLAIADRPVDLEQVAFVALLLAFAAGGSALARAQRNEAAAVTARRTDDAGSTFRSRGGSVGPLSALSAVGAGAGTSTLESRHASLDEPAAATPRRPTLR